MKKITKKELSYLWDECFPQFKQGDEELRDIAFDRLRRHFLPNYEPEKHAIPDTRYITIDETGLSARTKVICKRAGIKTVKGLMDYSKKRLSEMRNCGKVCIGEITCLSWFMQEAEKQFGWIAPTWANARDISPCAGQVVIVSDGESIGLGIYRRKKWNTQGIEGEVTHWKHAPALPGDDPDVVEFLSDGKRLDRADSISMYECITVRARHICHLNNCETLGQLHDTPVRDIANWRLCGKRTLAELTDIKADIAKEFNIKEKQ